MKKTANPGLPVAEEKPVRNYGIDLLRLVLMFMVCVMHSLNQGGVLKTLTAGTTAYNVYQLLYILSFCAVDGFAMISGYMAKDKPVKYSKIIDMWFQVFFYSFVVSLILLWAGLNQKYTGDALFKLAFPVSNSIYWYFTAYFASFFFAPFITKFVQSMDEKAAKRLFVLFLIIFSLLEFHNTVLDGLSAPFKAGNGYSAIWLIILYALGALAKRGRVFEKAFTPVLVALWALCNGFTWYMLIYQGKDYVYYTSPAMVLSGLCLIIIFSRISLKGVVLKYLSPLAFGIYLLQLNKVIWGNLKGAVAKLISPVWSVGIWQVLLIALVIFTCGLIVEFVRSKLHKLMRVNLLSELLEKVFRKALSGLAFLFS